MYPSNSNTRQDLKMLKENVGVHGGKPEEELNSCEVYQKENRREGKGREGKRRKGKEREWNVVLI